MSCICWPATGSVLEYIFLKPKSKLINYVWTFCKVWIRLLGGFITFNNYMFSLLQPESVMRKTSLFPQVHTATRDHNLKNGRKFGISPPEVES
jgi:hypothetical protein